MLDKDGIGDTMIYSEEIVNIEVGDILTCFPK